MVTAIHLLTIPPFLALLNNFPLVAATSYALLVYSQYGAQAAAAPTQQMVLRSSTSTDIPTPGLAATPQVVFGLAEMET